MNYTEATQWLFDQLPMYQQKGAVALNAKLDGITHFCAYLGEPHQKFKSIHVAGTNGKGSSSHMLAAILQEAGYKVGLIIAHFIFSAILNFPKHLTYQLHLFEKTQ